MSPVVSPKVASQKLFLLDKLTDTVTINLTNKALSIERALGSTSG